ncbi:hypothetical protein T06_10295 [Trichinella sp. T6]|nr:hypothetical protein T06_10295 [Trichinella sp. T6]
MKLTETIAILILFKSCIAQVATCKDDNNYFTQNKLNEISRAILTICLLLILFKLFPDTSESQIKCEHCG